PTSALTSVRGCRRRRGGWGVADVLHGVGAARPVGWGVGHRGPRPGRWPAGGGGGASCGVCGRASGPRGGVGVGGPRQLANRAGGAVMPSCRHAVMPSCCLDGLPSYRLTVLPSCRVSVVTVCRHTS